MYSTKNIELNQIVPPDVLSALGSLSVLAAMGGQLGAAQKIMDGVKLVRPDNYRVALLEGYVKIVGGEIDEGVTLLEHEVLSRYTDNKEAVLDANLYIGLAHLARKQSEDAKARLEEVINNGVGTQRAFAIHLMSKLEDGLDADFT